MKSLRSSQIGGILLALAPLIILITIVFEYQIEWIGVERAPEAVPGFMYDNWSALGQIWGWQMFGYFLFSLAFLQLLKTATEWMRLAWSALLLCALMIFVAFGLTLGAYPPALDVLGTHPALFSAIRGAVRALYLPGQMGIFLLFIPLFLFETFGKQGVIKRSWGIGTGAIIVLAILSGLGVGIPIKVTGASLFLLPLVVGISYWQNPSV